MSTNEAEAASPSAKFYECRHTGANQLLLDDQSSFLPRQKRVLSESEVARFKTQPGLIHVIREVPAEELAELEEGVG